MCGTEDLARRIAETQHVIQEKVVRFVRADQILGLLADFAVLRRQQLGRYRGIEHILQHVGQLTEGAVCLVSDKVAHQCFRN